MLQPPVGAQLVWLIDRLLSVVENVERSLRISWVPQRGQVTGGCSARRGTSCSNHSSHRGQRYSYMGICTTPWLGRWRRQARLSCQLLEQDFACNVACFQDTWVGKGVM